MAKGLDVFEPVTYAMLKSKINILNSEMSDVQAILADLPEAYSYKGSVSTVSDLPVDASVGDLYTVGSSQYVWNGTEWIMIGGVITNNEIDTLFE